MKSIKAYAVVNKKKPELVFNDIYTKDNVKDIFIDKDEKFIEVIIKANE